jgi:hypothetical protein
MARQWCVLMKVAMIEARDREEYACATRLVEPIRREAVLKDSSILSITQEDPFLPSAGDNSAHHEQISLGPRTDIDLDVPQAWTTRTHFRRNVQ